MSRIEWTTGVISLPISPQLTIMNGWRFYQMELGQNINKINVYGRMAFLPNGTWSKQSPKLEI